MEPLLEARGLTKIFLRDGRPPLTALDGVSFQLRPGEALGVVGESGSGKTTLARAVTRLIAPTEGTVRVEGRDVTRAGGRALREVYRAVQMVFQTPGASFDPRRTLGDGVGEGLRCLGLSRREARARAEELLARCGLPAAFFQRYPRQVSGGECQRAAIARALAVGPKVLVCDEATSALDVTVQRQIMDLLRSLRETQGLSYLFICHNLALVQSFCDRLLVMKDGRVVEEGTPDEVIGHPRAAYTKLLVDAAL